MCLYVLYYILILFGHIKFQTKNEVNENFKIKVLFLNSENKSIYILFVSSPESDKT